MKVRIEDLVNYDWNRVVLYGKKEDEASWRWDTEKKYTNEEVIATPIEVQKAATGYGALEWEMDCEEGEEGYVDECAARDEWMNEVVNFNLEMLKIAGLTRAVARLKSRQPVKDRGWQICHPRFHFARGMR